jgi:hypothetical protein
LHYFLLFMQEMLHRLKMFSSKIIWRLSTHGRWDLTPSSCGDTKHASATAPFCTVFGRIEWRWLMNRWNVNSYLELTSSARVFHKLMPLW